MCSSSAVLTLVLIEDSGYATQTLKLVVEHIHGLILAKGRRRRHSKTALDIILTLVEKATPSLVDTAWITDLLASAARGDMNNDMFALFLRLSAQRKEEDAPQGVETPLGQDPPLQADGADPQSPGGVPLPQATTPGYTLFVKILQNIQVCSGAGGWQDEAVYGGLIAMRDIPRLGHFPPDHDFLVTLYEAMDKGRPFRVRKSAYDVILTARDGWLRLPELRHLTFENRPSRIPLRDTRLDFPRRLWGVVTETSRCDHQRSFLQMIEILSEDRDWHSYLREAMDIWLPFRHEGPDQVLHILSRVGALSTPLPGRDGSNSNLNKFLAKLVEDEWAGVPGRLAEELTADRMEPLAEVTKQFRELLFNDGERRAVLAVVEQVIPSLEKRRDGGYEDVRGIVDGVLEILQVRVPIESTSCESTYY